MENKKKKNMLDFLKDEELENTASFVDIMSRSEQKNHDKIKKNDLELESEIKAKMKVLEEKKKELEEKEAQENQKKLQNIKNELEIKRIDKKKNSKKEINKKVVEETPILEELRQKREITEDIEPKTSKKNINKIFLSMLLIITLFASFGNIVYNVLYTNSMNKYFDLTNATLISLIIFTFLIVVMSKGKKLKTVFKYFTTLLLGGLVCINLLVNFNIVKFPKVEVVPDFTNTSITEALNWATDNKIIVEQLYEYSDNIEEYNIIFQSVKANTPLKKVQEITLTVSYGPNYDKQVTLSNMVGWTIDDALKVIEENFLNNVEINYVINNDIAKDTIISQNIKGNIKRNDKLVLEVSLGTEDSLTPVDMVDLSNKTLFEATLWLKRNGIKYKLEYDFSDKIARNSVISQSERKGTQIDPKTNEVTLIVSKGAKIVLPNFMTMNIDEVVKWIINNKLKIEFIDKYDTKVEQGKIISSSHKENDVVEEGTVITITTSKGQLKLKEFTDLNEFRTWASNYGVKYREEYEFNNDIERGKIIKFSVEKDTVLNPDEEIVVYVSDGTSVTIPNFYGMTKSAISNKCKTVGLNCTFYYTNSTNTYDTAVSQNKRSGATVVNGTYVSIGLSNGKSGVTPPPPACDKSKTVQVFLYPGNTGSQSQSMLPSGIKWNVTFVSSCPNGSIASGEICNAASYDGKYLNYCDTYNIQIIR